MERAQSELALAQQHGPALVRENVLRQLLLLEDQTRSHTQIIV